MSELDFIFLVCWDLSEITFGCVVVVDVCVDVSDCDGAMNDCEDAVVAWCADNDDCNGVMDGCDDATVAGIGCNADWKDHLMNQNH